MHLDDERLSKILDDMPPEEPPADLRSSVMSAIRVRNVVPMRRRHFPRLLYGWVAAAAVVFGFFFFSSVRDTTNTAATMATPEVTVAHQNRLILISVARPGSISVRWDPNSADLVAISGPTDASSSPHETSFTLGNSPARVTLRARPGATAVSVSVSVDGRQIHSETIRL